MLNLRISVHILQHSTAIWTWYTKLSLLLRSRKRLSRDFSPGHTINWLELFHRPHPRILLMLLHQRRHNRLIDITDITLPGVGGDLHDRLILFGTFSTVQHFQKIHILLLVIRQEFFIIWVLMWLHATRWYGGMPVVWMDSQIAAALFKGPIKLGVRQVIMFQKYLLKHESHFIIIRSIFIF